MTEDPLEISADQIIRAGNIRGASPFETAGAIQRWRSALLEKTRSGDGEQWANKVAKLDSESVGPVLDYLRSDALKQGATPEQVKADPSMWTPAIQRLKAPIVAGGQQIGSFDLVMGDSPTAIAYSFNGPGNERVAIPLPKPTPEAIDARKKELAAEAERGKADAERAKAQFDELTSPPKDFLDALGKGAVNDQGGGLGKQFSYQIEDGQRRQREALLKLDNLTNNPELGFLSDQLEAKITSPELRDKFGGVRLGEDFQRGLASFYTGTRVAWNDLTLDTPERQEWEKIHQAVPDIYPGTNQALKGPIAGTVAQLSETAGGQVLPLAVMAGSSGLAGPLAEVGSAAGLGMMGATSYGATRADSAAQSDYLKRQAELLRQAGHTQAADDTAKRAEMIAQSAVPRALATAATEIATEKMFPEEKLLAGAAAKSWRDIGRKTLTSAAQNAAEEATAQTAQGNVIDPASGLPQGTAGDVAQAATVGALFGGTLTGATELGRSYKAGEWGTPSATAPQGPPPPVQPPPQQAAPEAEPTPAPDPAAEQRQRAKAAAQAAAPDPQTAAAVEQIFATAEAAANGDPIPVTENQKEVPNGQEENRQGQGRQEGLLSPEPPAQNNEPVPSGQTQDGLEAPSLPGEAAGTGSSASVVESSVTPEAPSVNSENAAPTTVIDLARSPVKAARNVDPEAFKQRVAEETAPPPAKPRQWRAPSRESELFRQAPFANHIITQTPMLSRSKAMARGRDFWERVKPFYDSAPRLSHPTHNVIYGGSSTPDQVAQALQAEGLLPDGDVETLWRQLANESAGAVSIARQERSESRSRETEEKQQRQQDKAFNKATKTGGQEVAVDDLHAGQEVVIEGETMKVADVVTDQDGYVQTVVLEDGSKFGRQILDNGDRIFVESVSETPDVAFGPEDDYSLATQTEADVRAQRQAEEERRKRYAQAEELSARMARTMSGDSSGVGQGTLFSEDEDLFSGPSAQRTTTAPSPIDRAKEAGRDPSKWSDAQRTDFEAAFRGDSQAFQRLSKIQQSAFRQIATDAEAQAVGIFQDTQGALPSSPTFDRARNGDEQAFDELDRMLRARYGQVPSAGRAGADVARDASHRRFTTDTFSKSFQQAFAAGDFDTALELVKQTEKGVYVPFMKELFRAEKAGDPAASQMAEWMRHIFSGTRPANAAAQPPPQPAPPQQGSGTAGPAAQQPPPAPPPPPPSPPPRTPGEAFNMPALVRFLKEIKGSAVLNRAFRTTRGAYRGGPNPKIELHQHLFKDPAQALKTFSHEIGHFIDYVRLSVKGSRLAARLVPMKNFGVVFAHLMGWSKGKMSPIAKLLRDEARALSRVWRGDFDNGDEYRDSSAELYADFMSALLTDPDWTMQVAPQMTNAFFAALEQKPEVESAYNLLQTLLKTDTLLKILPNDASAASRSAIERVVAQVEAEQARRHSARAFMRGMWGAFVNRYDVIASKAGGFMNAQRLRRENFGSDFATQMEMADGYALREKALLENRLRREVYNPLAASGIDKEDLATVLKNNRILNERTATGAAIEANPNEARKLFTWMVEQSTLDQRQWKADIVQAADADLYALGARLMSKLHFNGDFERVTRAAQRQDAPDWAEKAMFAFDVSGFMMNPQGITPVEAQKQNDEIFQNLGPQRAAVLQKSVQSFYDAMRTIVMKANDAGLFRPSLWQERIAPNLGNYVPFMVLDYLTGDVNASIKQRFGTFKDILPAHLAGALKAGALLGRIARQQSSLTLKDFFTRVGRQYGFAQEMTIRDELSDQEAARISRAGGSSRIFWDKGQVKHMIFTDDTATWVDQPDLAEWMKTTMAVADSLGNFFKHMWTVFSFAFTIVSNPRRQILTTIDRGGVRGTAYMFGALKLAREYRDAHFSDNWTPRIRQLIAEGVLPPPQAHVRADIAPDEFVDELMRGVIAASNMRSPVHMGRLETLARKLPPINWTLDRMMGWNATVESIAKIGKYEERLKAGDNKAKAVAFARLEGIPNPGVNGGKYTRFFEPLFPFLRVHLQGLRATKQLATQKETRGGFLLRVTLRHVLSKGWVLLGAAGVLDQVWKKLFGDDKDQTDLQEFYRRVTPYKIENEDVIPFAWKTPTGWAPVMGHQTVPRDWVPVALRLGFSEEGRFVSPMLAATMFTLADKITGKKSGVAPVEPAARIADAMGNLILPDFNPSVGITSNYFDFFDKAPPRDNYRGQAIATDDEWNAGYASRAYALTRAALSDFQVLGTKLSDAAGMKQQYQADDPFPFWNKMPGFKAMVASDNYAGVRDDQTIARDDAKRDAVAREMRGPATKRAVSRMEGLERKGKDRRTEDENSEYAELRKWYRTYYQAPPEKEGATPDPEKKDQGLMRVLKKAAAGDKTVDVEYARKRLEETAAEALKATKAGTPVTAP